MVGSQGGFIDGNKDKGKETYYRKKRSFASCDQLVPDGSFLSVTCSTKGLYDLEAWGFDVPTISCVYLMIMVCLVPALSMLHYFVFVLSFGACFVTCCTCATHHFVIFHVYICLFTLKLLSLGTAL